MARKSRKNLDFTETISVETKAKVFQTAIYARLSKEDKRIDTDCSIETQIELIKQFVREKPYLQVYDIYADNGFTGTNFERPSFIKMMEEIKKGNISCVLVKDLSRFGRHYTEVGNFIEKIFPFMGVRFISVNDDVDTFSPDLDKDFLSIQLKMIMHDYYSKNLSNNIQSVLDKKKQNGEYIGNHPPYGYKKDEINRRKFAVDKEAATVVQEIFDLRLQGLPYAGIGQILNKKGILSPNAYFSKKGYTICGVKTNNNYWDNNNVKRILINEAYIGNLVQGKVRSNILTGKKNDKQDTSNWIIVKGTHEPIISKDIFQKVQNLNFATRTDALKNRGKYDEYIKIENIFKGVFSCGICGNKVYRTSYVAKGKTMKYRYYCKNNNIHSDTSVHVLEINIINAIESELKRKIALFVNFQGMLLHMKQGKETVSRIETIRKNITIIKQNMTKKENLLKSLYEDLSEEIISKDEYDYAKKVYLDEYNSLQNRLQELTDERNCFDDTFINENPFAKAVNDYKDGFTLTQVIIEKFIEEVVVYPNDCIEVKYKMEDDFKKLIEFGEKNGVSRYE